MARKRSRIQKPNVVAWSDVFAKFFGLGATGGWTPPSTVSCRKTVKGYTFVAIFRDEAGRPVRLTTRVAYVCSEDRFKIVDEKLDVTYRIEGRAAA